jgi:hypothetical protein
MNHLTRLVIGFLLALSSIGASSDHATAAQVVFDNTASPSVTSFGPGCCQVGNEITLGGNAREISELSWQVSSQRMDVVAEFETRIYANNGVGGSPGSLLWSSGPISGIHVSASDTFLDIAVPNISVPPIVTITSIVLNSTPVALGRVRGGSPSVGSVTTAWYETSPDVWQQAPNFGPWGLRVLAVPEPSGVSLAITSGFLLIWLSRPSKRWSWCTHLKAR